MSQLYITPFCERCVSRSHLNSPTRRRGDPQCGIRFVIRTTSSHKIGRYYIFIVILDKCPGANEYFACGVACDNDCSTLQFQNKTNCPIQNIVCNRMCYCEDGFARNTLGNCIPFAECRMYFILFFLCDKR